MTDVVISGRIPNSLMDQLKKLGKTNTEIINEALRIYIIEKTQDNNSIQKVYERKTIDEYNLLCKVLDSLPGRYYQFLDKKEFFKHEP